MEILRQQYNFVKSSRVVLLSYCTTITEKDFLRENSLFGKGSIRNLLVHVGNTYEYWIGKHGLNKDISFKESGSVTDVHLAMAYFLEIDLLMQEFFYSYSEKMDTELHLNLDSKAISMTPLKLFTHVITHEFHHKGQILSLSRHLGYIPVDTDIIR